MTLPILRSALALLAAAVLAAGASAQLPLTIEDLFQIRQAGSAVISPDGQSVAYTVTVPRDVPNGASDGVPHVELHIATGPEQNRAYVAGEGRISAIAWTPDGQGVTFLANRAGDSATALYRIDIAGGEAQRIYAHSQAIRSYAIAPDGTTLFFVAQDRPDPMRARLSDRGFRANVFEEQQVFSHVWRADLSDREADATRFDLPGHATQVVLSPDGSLLAVDLAPTALVDDNLMSRRWHVVNARTGAVISSAQTLSKLGSAAFSPDNARLAFLAGVDRADPTAGTLHIADVRTGAMEIIDRDAEQHLYGFAWQDDRTVLTLAHTGTTSALVQYGVDGEAQARTPFEGGILRAIDLHRDSGAIAAVVDAPTHPREVFAARPGEAFARWTDHNPQLASIAWGVQRTVEWDARDGERVEGVLITPQGRAPRGGWPLIMTVHGGPEAHDSDGWLNNYSRFGHIAAGEGFAILFPNYRGSTGRGERFMKLDHLDPPGDEFWDIVDAIAPLAQEGLIDPDRVGITGGSYGGFASAWGATIATEHFAAAAPFVALTDLVSFFGTTEIPVEMIDVHFMEYPWENFDLYVDKSPIRHAQGSRTPTLILHGEADTRVDTTQSFILYRFLQLAGDAPVRLVTYPGEGHGNARAAAQYDYALRVMRWMQHYLQGEGGEPPPAELPLPELLGLND
ncbi:S9 family peptidase [Hyphomonadaceae bacterium BL14]|nr:S9 family peptidase [Hyphomonadaceae bacterium BL14]